MDILRNIFDENDPNYVLCMKLPALATLTGIISISLFFYSIFIVFAFIHINPGIVIMLIVIHTMILIMVLWSFARVFFSDPGYVKRTIQFESLSASHKFSPLKQEDPNKDLKLDNEKFNHDFSRPSLYGKQVEDFWSTIYTNNPVKKECLKKLESFKRNSTKKIIYDDEDQSFHPEYEMKFEERKSICDERDSLRKFSNDKLESSPVSEDKHHLFDQDEEISDEIKDESIVKTNKNKAANKKILEEIKEIDKFEVSDDHNIEYYFCVACQNIRPPIAQHCKLCRKCVIRRDHHCSWVGNCIGQKNHKFLILLMFYSAHLTFFQFVCYTIGMALEWYRPYPLEEKILIILICIWFLLHFSVASIDAFFCFLINLSLLYTIIILFKDLTSEKLGQFFRSNWSIRNIEKIFGSNKCTWMIPVSPKNLPKYDEIHI